MTTTITSLQCGTTRLTKAHPGGLIAIGTTLDPACCRASLMSGTLVVREDDTTATSIVACEQLVVNYDLVETERKGSELNVGEKVLINCHSANTTAQVTKIDSDANLLTVTLLETPICAQFGVTKVSISKKYRGVFVVAHGPVVDGILSG